MKIAKNLFALTPLCAGLCIGSAHATNGMYMEGYGPISAAMGGASQAINHGNAAMAQNPATLGMVADGSSRFDLAIGFLGPDVKSKMMGMDAPSGGTAYIMPAIGYTQRQGALTYGIGVFAQGGMGTEYDANTFLAMGSGGAARSELGIGNVIIPVAYQVNSALTVGATFKYMWSSLDMMMAASGAQLGGMVTGVSGNLGQAMPQLGGAPWARLHFSDDNKFTGSAKATGYGASVGAVLQLSPTVTMGASYQFKSALDDMKTDSNATTLSATGGFADKGRMTIVDFQMPAVWAMGISWQAEPSLLLAADIKSIAWSSTMQNFKMRYDSAGMGGSVSFVLPQNWKDQTVLNLGAAWQANAQWTLRAGLNLADNPIPDAYVNPLFPATVRSHWTLGAGYRISPTDSLNAAMTITPNTTVTNASGVEISHAQRNFQLLYTRQF